MNHPLRKMTAVVLALFATSALAIQDDRIRGEVLAVDDDARTLEIKILEVGDNVDAEIGAIETYNVPTDVAIDFEIEGSVYDPYPGYRFSDIEDGDTVLLDFAEQAARSEVTRIRNQPMASAGVRDRVLREGRFVGAAGSDAPQGEQLASRDTSSGRTALPDSASAVPSLALMGVFLALLAGTLRYWRS